MGILSWLLVGLVAGWMAVKVTKRGRSPPPLAICVLGGVQTRFL